MKSGTLTTSPVSIVAGLPEPVTVAPLIDGCVSATVNSTVVGTVTPITSVPRIGFSHQSFQGCKAIHFQRLRLGFVLVVSFSVHEVGSFIHFV